MRPRDPWIEHLTLDEKLNWAQAIDLLDGYEMIPFVLDGEHAGTMLKKNAEVHFAMFRKFRKKAGVITRRTIREFLQPIFEREGFLVTKLADGEPDDFTLRMGFEEIGRTVSHRIFMLTRIKPLGELK
jgi:hypothetical protein